MDHGAFDALTRSLAGGAQPRRGVLRLLAGGALGGLLARLGLDDVVAKKHGKRHDDKKRLDKLHTAGKKQKKRKNKKKDKDREQLGDPEPEPNCPLDKFPCPDGTCVPWGECCALERRCRLAGVCKPVEECCPGERDCGDLTCVKEGECCEHEKECDDGSCQSQDECCPGYWECPGGGCGKIGDCCPGTHRCGETGCISIDECCEEDKPQCGGCSQLICFKGEWLCDPVSQGEECPADPGRCCPTHLEYPVSFCHENGLCCLREGGSSTVLCLAPLPE